MVFAMNTIILLTITIIIVVASSVVQLVSSSICLFQIPVFFGVSAIQIFSSFSQHLHHLHRSLLS